METNYYNDLRLERRDGATFGIGDHVFVTPGSVDGVIVGLAVHVHSAPEACVRHAKDGHPATTWVHLDYLTADERPKEATRPIMPEAEAAAPRETAAAEA